MPRLADATGGRVLVGGTDVRDIPLAELRAARRVRVRGGDAVLRQRARRTSRSAPPAASDDEIEAALTAAQARFAYDLPWGLDTRIGEQGMALSGGQRQRVALARAILARPQVLILDDPLSALDVHTEERVTRALGQILTGVTAIVVAHRPSTVALADRVALLDGGVIAATGSHRELMATEPVYANLMTMEEVADERRYRRRGHGDTAADAPSAPPRRGRRPGAASAASRSTTSPRRWRRCCGGAAGCCCRTCSARTGGRSAGPRLAIMVSSLAALAGPWLIGLAIDNGIPPLLKSGDAGPLLLIAAAFAVTVGVQAVTTRMFVTMTGRIGQAVVLELRRRLFAHLLRLSVSFHESYTSGRVISRQTSDVEAISALFEEGLDGLITAVLTLLLVGTGMLLLDWRLGLVVLSGFLPLIWLSAWFRRESATAYRRIRETNALVIAFFVETFGGLRAVQAFRREERNDEIFDRLSADYAVRDHAVLAAQSPSSRPASRWSGT